MNKPMTRSCIKIDREKQMALRVKRLIRARKVVCLVVYPLAADKSSMHSYVCTPQHEMGHLRTVFPIARSQEGHQSEDV